MGFTGTGLGMKDANWTPTTTGKINGKQYVNGEIADGMYKNKMNIDDELANGTANGKMYQKGVLINKKTVNGKYYVNDELANGKKTYKNGVVIK